MRATHAAIVGSCYLAGVGIAAVVISSLSLGDLDMSLVVGAALGSGVAASLYHSRDPAKAPAAVKLAFGALMAALCVPAGILLHSVDPRMTSPEIVIPISAVGTLVLPLAGFETMRKALLRARNREGRT